jgi:hypothetical protein
VKVLLRSFVVLAVTGALAVPLASAQAAPGGKAAAARQSVGTPSFGHIGTVVDSQTETDLLTGSVHVFSRTEDYDSRGRIVHSLEVETVDGVAIWTYESTGHYGANGIETIVTVADPDGDGASPADLIVSTFGYDSRGFLTTVDTTYDYGTDGTIDDVDHEVYTNDKRGRRLTIHVELSDVVIDSTYTYDKRGNETTAVDVYDDVNDPGAPDQKYASSAEYDRRNNFVSGVDEFYTYDDQGTATLAERYTFTSEYHNGRRVAEHSTADFDGDGTIDGVSDAVLGYDKRGNQTSSVQTIVEGGQTTVITDLTTFDKRGNLTYGLHQEEVDGQLTYRREDNDTFDTKGRFTGHTDATDFDGDGVVDEALRQVVNGWDSRGRVTNFHTTDEDGAGNVLAVHDVTIEWFRYYQVRTSFHDDDNDGTYDRKLVLVVPTIY